MDTIKNIKVSAYYETDTTPSKFDALLKQYELAKTIADGIENEKQPLIDAMGKKKLELIYKQLDVLVKRLNILSKCKNSVVSISAWNWEHTPEKITIQITTHYNWNEPEIYLCGNRKPRESWFKKDGIVTLWNELKLYEQLEEKCNDKLEEMIKQQNEREQYINTNYNNMINY